MKAICACRSGDHAHVQAAEAQASASDSSPESTQQQLQMAGKLGSRLTATSAMSILHPWYLGASAGQSPTYTLRPSSG